MSRSKLLEQFGFKDEEVEELVAGGEYAKTGFPTPIKSYRMMWEVPDLSLEEPYYWVLDNLKLSMPIVEKLEDSFAAAENSAFFGVTQQRLGGQQGQISQLLATTGKMIKELFQMVRELRIIKERLKYYDGVAKELDKPIAERKKADEITLKGMFIDLVQGGAKSAASVYGMARELEFVTLPDLFFDAPPFKTQDELEKHIRSLEKDFNQNVLRVLIRHLNQYFKWRDQTATEHRNRKQFMLSYLLQHFEIIKMYINWVKPYLKHTARLTMKEAGDSPHLVSAFEGSMLDIELLARKKRNKANACLLVTFNYRTRPELKVVQEGYQRGPVHIGRMELHQRVYRWSDEQVENYRKLKNQEVLDLMGNVSSSVQAAMESLGEELDKYLDEARENAKIAGKEERKEEKKPEKKSIVEKLFGDFYNPKKKKESSGKAGEKAEEEKSARELKAEAEAFEKDMDKVISAALGAAWGVYHYFKKGHGMIAW